MTRLNIIKNNLLGVEMKVSEDTYIVDDIELSGLHKSFSNRDLLWLKVAFGQHMVKYVSIDKRLLSYRVLLNSPLRFVNKSGRAVSIVLKDAGEEILEQV